MSRLTGTKIAAHRGLVINVPSSCAKRYTGKREICYRLFGDGLAVDHRGNSMRCRFAALAVAMVIGGAFTVGHAHAQYYRYPPNSPYAQPPYAPPRYAMPPDADVDDPMYDPREEPAPQRGAAAGPQYAPQYAPPYGPPPYGGPPAAIPDDNQGAPYGYGARPAPA